MKTFKQISVKVKRINISAEDQSIYKTKLDSPESVTLMARSILGDTDQESCFVVPLDVKNKPLGIQVVGLGGPDSCPVNPRMVFRSAILLGASGIIVIHNHPSNDTTPSKEDIDLTKALIEGSKILGITFLDHVIVTDETYKSLRQDCSELWY